MPPMGQGEDPNDPERPLSHDERERLRMMATLSIREATPRRLIIQNPDYSRELAEIAPGEPARDYMNVMDELQQFSGWWERRQQRQQERLDQMRAREELRERLEAARMYDIRMRELMNRPEVVIDDDAMEQVRAYIGPAAIFLTGATMAYAAAAHYQSQNQ